MFEDRRAHERIDSLEAIMRKHMEDHVKFEKSIAENTDMMRQMVENTKEIVILVRGAKGLRAFILWVTPIVSAIIAVYTAVKMKIWL